MSSCSDGGPCAAGSPATSPQTCAASSPPRSELSSPAWDWAAHDALTLDDRYRERQLPLLAPGSTHRQALQRSLVLPLPGLASAALTAILAELRASAVAPYLWWEGLARRADRLHATLAPGLPPTDGYAGSPGPVTVVLRGPWVGRFNTGRIYLPVEPADPASAAVLDAVRLELGAPLRRPLMGWLQLTDDVGGRAYADLRALVAAHADDEVARVAVPELWLLDATDDLVLRSAVAQRIPLPQSS